MAESGEGVVQSGDETDKDQSQNNRTDLQALSSPKAEFQGISTHNTLIKPQPIQTGEDNLLQAAFYILYTVPRAIEDFIDREYKGGFLQAISDHKDKLKAKIRTEEWNLLSQITTHPRLYHFYDKIIQDTILDKDVLDLLIYRCILSIEDREEIEQHPRQSDRNQCILDLLIQRPEDSYSVLIEVLKESPTCSKDLIETMEGQPLSHHEVVPQSKVKPSITGDHLVRLQKNYHNLIQNLSDVRNVIDLLISSRVLEPDDYAEITTSGVPAEMNRKLIARIRSEEDYLFLLEALKEDSVSANEKLASDLESTTINQDELNQTVPSLTNRPGFQTLVTLVSMVEAVEVSDTEPDRNDTRLAADLYRVQSWYKKVIKMTSMDLDKYQQFVQTVEKFLGRISGKNVPDVKKTTLNTGMQQQVKKILHGLEEKEEHSSLIERIIKIEAEQKEVIPKNIRDQIKAQIKDWVKKDRIFVSTKASDYVMARLQDNSCVTLTAPSGVGKSFIARHTSLVLRKEGYNIIPVKQPDDIEAYYQPGKQTVFIVDDICGNFTANQQQIERWKQLLPVINTIIADKYCKIIVSCRLQVYNDDKFNILSPFKSCECNLISDKLCLTSVEKHAIAKTYIGSILNDIDKLSQNCEFFPLLCSLYDIEKNRDVEDFFKNPFNVYQDELDNLNRDGDEGILRICSLALCVIFNNQLEEKWFKGKLTDEQKHIIEDICDACEINRITSKAKLKKALDILDGTFICKQNGIYRTLHDKLFDFLAHYFGRKMIECLIDHGDSALVQERFIWQKSPDDQNSNIDFIIEIPDEYLESYLERFIKEWSAGKLAAVFSNKNMEDSSFRQRLLQYLLQLDKSQQVTLANTKDTVIPQGCYGSGNIPLISACYGGYTDMVQWVLCNDGVVDQCRNDGVNGMIMASQEGNIDIVRLLLAKNPDVDVCNHNGCSSLLKASQNGHTDIVRLLLEREYVNINVCDNDECSPLYMASQNGHTYIVKLLLEKNPNVNLCDAIFGCSPLYIVSNIGHADIVKLLLENDSIIVDLCDNEGCSPLFMASHNGHIDVVRLLLEKDSINVDLCDENGRSPLLIASYQGHTNIVKVLLEKDPNVNLCSNHGDSPLLQACQNGHTDIVKLLLEKDSYVDLCNKNGRSPLLMASYQGHTDIVKVLLEKDPNVDLCDNDGRSPLLMASDQGHTNIVKVLLEKDPNVNLCNNHGDSPLLQACQNGHTDIVKLLLEKDSYVDLCDNDGQSPLLIASYQGHTDIVQVLLEKDSYVDLCDNDGRSPLLMASDQGHTDIVKLLLENDSIIVDLCDNEGCSPLFMASHNGHIDVVRLLLEKDSINVDLCDENGLSPLLIASYQGHTNIVKVLLEKDPNVNLCNNHGDNPLLRACQNGHTDIVKLLLEKDSYVDLCSNNGFTPLMEACCNNHISIVQLLMKHKPNINAQSYDGGNALYFSANNGNVEITKLLLENNAECNVCGPSKQTITDAIKNDPKKKLHTYKQNCFDSLTNIALSNVKDFLNKKSGDYVFDMEAGSSPLHIACFMGWKEVVGCLLDHNANIDIAKEDGTTPLFYACEVGHDNIVRLLLDKGADTHIYRLDGKSNLKIATDNGHKSIVVMLTNHTKEEDKLSS